MLKIIKRKDVQQNLACMRKAWSLRHEVFVEEKQWLDLEKPDKLEIDQFDNKHALHMLAFKDDELVGYQRMLPTTQPYLLNSVYPQLCELALPNDPRTWEWTRFAVKKPHRVRGRKLSPIANKLLSAIVEWGLKENVSSIIIEMNPLWLLRLAQLHFRVTALGITHVLEGEDVLAVKASFDHRTLLRLEELRSTEDHIPAAQARS
ncbi:acyl-homoserine-lactone synthase [Ahrensia marina]|uniref:Acyl-homoserine-lactone synthase n=1 Tax=Ahrensia marina TaxID=1514904 RepID=A0A0N0E6S1_9HYPH|nr:GNAT family N-acetyltransferase [Ahrensia marina]KPB00345.1 autoinducer synthase [Ahrensia marina]